MENIQHGMPQANALRDLETDQIKEEKARSKRDTLTLLGDEIADSTSEVRQAVNRNLGWARDTVAKTAKAVGKQVDHSVRKSPWTYIAGAAGMASVLSFLLGRKSKRQPSKGNDNS